MTSLINRFKKINIDSKIIIKNVFWAFLIKGLSLLVSFFSVPAFISYFDNNVYLGVWYTLLSVLIWAFTFDFGLGNGIRNKLVKAFTTKSWHDAKCIISSGLTAISVIIVLMCVAGVVILQFVNLNALLNVSTAQISSEELTTAVVITFAAIMLRFILVSVSSIFYALQRSSVNNLLAFISSLLILIYVLAFRFDTPGEALINLSWAYMICYAAPPVVAAMWLFLNELKHCRPSFGAITKKHSKQIIRIGGVFFYCQILFTLIINTDQFLITYFFGPDATVDYTFYYRLTSLVGMIVMLAITPIWSMVTKAFEEKKIEWLSKLYVRLKKIGWGIIILEFFFIPAIQPLMNLWLGNASIRVDYLTAIAFAVFNGCFIYQSIVSAIVCGLEKMKLQAFFYTLGIVLKIALVFVFASITGNWIIVVWGNVLVFLPYDIAETIRLNRFFKKLNTNTPANSTQEEEYLVEGKTF